MISKFSGFNFRGFKEFCVELSPGVNVFHGKTDSGKSALLKSIAWPLANKPSKRTGYVRKKTTETGSTLILSEGTEIRRRRESKKQLYSISIPGEDTEGFTAFRTKIPERIEEALSIDPEINLQTQFSAHFLVSNSTSGGARASFFNRIVNLGKMDKALSESKKFVKELDSKKKASEGLLISLEGQRAELSYLDDLGAELEALEALEELARITESDWDNLNQKIAAKHSYESQLDGLVDVGDLDDLLPSEESLKKVGGEHSRLEEIIRSRQIIEQDLLKVGTVDVVGLDLLEQEIKNFQELEERCGNLDAFLQLRINLEGSIGALDDQIREADQKLHALIPEGVCPLCGRSE